MLWTGLGLVVGIMFSVSTNSRVTVVVFSAAGHIYWDSLVHWLSVGAFKDEWTISDSKKSRILEILKSRSGEKVKYD